MFTSRWWAWTLIKGLSPEETLQVRAKVACLEALKGHRTDLGLQRAWEGNYLVSRRDQWAQCVLFVCTFWGFQACVFLFIKRWYIVKIKISTDLNSTPREIRPHSFLIVNVSQFFCLPISHTVLFIFWFCHIFTFHKNVNTQIHVCAKFTFTWIHSYWSWS